MIRIHFFTYADGSGFLAPIRGLPPANCKLWSCNCLVHYTYASCHDYLQPPVAVLQALVLLESSCSPALVFSPQKPQVTDLKRFPNESYSCLCTCLTCPNPSTPGWKRFVNQPMSGSHLVQAVTSFNSIRCRRSRYLPLRMKAHGPRKSSLHPHRANNGPSTAIGAIRPSDHSIERVFCLKSHSGGWQSRAMSSMAAPAPWKALRKHREICCMTEDNLSVADKDWSVSPYR